MICNCGVRQMRGKHGPHTSPFKKLMCASAFDGGRVCVSGDKGGESGEKRHFRLTRRLFHQHIKADELAALLCSCLMPFTLTLLAALLLMLLFFCFTLLLHPDH